MYVILRDYLCIPYVMVYNVVRCCLCEMLLDVVYVKCCLLYREERRGEEGGGEEYISVDFYIQVQIRRNSNVIDIPVTHTVIPIKANSKL